MASWQQSCGPRASAWQGKAAHFMAVCKRQRDIEGKWQENAMPLALCFLCGGPFPLLPGAVSPGDPVTFRGSSSECCWIRRQAYDTGAVWRTLHIQTVTLLMCLWLALCVLSLLCGWGWGHFQAHERGIYEVRADPRA